MSQRRIFSFFQGETCVLSDLILEDCHIDDKLLESLLKATHMTTGLQHLNLSCNNIGKNGIPLLARLVLQTFVFLFYGHVLRY